MRRLFGVPASALDRDGPVKLHLGCFDQTPPGWINTDVTPHLLLGRLRVLPRMLHLAGLLSRERLEQHRQGVFAGVCYLDLTAPFPLSSESVDCIFTSHVLEHLFPADAELALTECLRILRPGGVLRVVVPDLDRLVDAYAPEDPDGFLEAVFESRQRGDKNRHHWHYNAHSLPRLMRRIGFTAAEVCSYRSGKCPDLEVMDNRPESLFVEATK